MCTMSGIMLWMWTRPHLREKTLRAVPCGCQHTHTRERKPYVPYFASWVCSEAENSTKDVTVHRLGLIWGAGARLVLFFKSKRASEQETNGGGGFCVACDANNLPERKRTQLNPPKKKISYFASHLILHRLTLVYVSFCCLTKVITPIICRLCVCVLTSKRSFEPFMCLDLVLEH